jgi:hypothetical protein
VSWSCSTWRAWAAVSTQVATPWLLVCGVHRRVCLVLNDTGWPLSGRPEAVSAAVTVIAWCGLRRMLAVSAVRARVTVWVSVLADAA